MCSHNDATPLLNSKNEIPKKNYEKKIKSQQILPSCNCNKENIYPITIII